MASINIGKNIVHLADCIEVLRSMPDNSVDSIVTDPPYGLSFMGKKWDYDVPGTEVWAECLRVLKPGGHLLAFAGTRTQHRMAVRIEDAGFEIRDVIAWVYGSGFPKSLNLNGNWEGWGTALKPAHEPITVARKPLIGTVAVNVLQHGTGALNIDGCRVRADDAKGYAYTVQHMAPGADQNKTDKTHQEGVEYQGQTKDGRWPANLIHDGSDEVVQAFPQAGGALAPVKGTEPSCKTGEIFGLYGERAPIDRRDGGGSAARFFYCAKASRSDRNEGLPSGDKPAVGTSATMREREDADWSTRNGNHHPTVKPTDLMAYLCRLVTPPGGTVLDPFMGSGSTGKAAIRERFQFVGIEKDPEYIKIAIARIEHEFSTASQSKQYNMFAEQSAKVARAISHGQTR